MAYMPLLSSFWVVLAKIRLRFEDQPIVAPPLQVPDFLGCLFFVVDHYIGRISQAAQGIDAGQVLLWCAVEIG